MVTNFRCYDCNRDFTTKDKYEKHRETRACRKRQEKNGKNIMEVIESFSFNYVPKEEKQEGYIYCFSNPTMPDILKIGMTLRTPEKRLMEANQGTWTPLPFEIEIAKKVLNPLAKEKNIHEILKDKRVNNGREFFRVTLEEVKNIFNRV
jgi:hypothetical protein